jgi:hypothetical protein
MSQLFDYRPFDLGLKRAGWPDGVVAVKQIGRRRWSLPLFLLVASRGGLEWILDFT